MDKNCLSYRGFKNHTLIVFIISLGFIGCKTSNQSQASFQGDMIGQGCVASDAECQSICGIIAYKTTHKTGICAKEDSRPYQCFCEDPLPDTNVQDPEMEGYIYRGCMANSNDCSRDCTTGDSTKKNFLAITDGPCSRKTEEVYEPIDCWCKFAAQ